MSSNKEVNFLCHGFKRTFPFHPAIGFTSITSVGFATDPEIFAVIDLTDSGFLETPE